MPKTTSVCRRPLSVRRRLAATHFHHRCRESPTPIQGFGPCLWFLRQDLRTWGWIRHSAQDLSDLDTPRPADRLRVRSPRSWITHTWGATQNWPGLEPWWRDARFVSHTICRWW